MVNDNLVDRKQRLLNVEEASLSLGLKTHAFKHQFYNRSNKTDPTPTYVGGRVYFTPESLDRFVERHTKGESDVTTQ